MMILTRIKAGVVRIGQQPRLFEIFFSHSKKAEDFYSHSWLQKMTFVAIEFLSFEKWFKFDLGRSTSTLSWTTIR